MWKYLISLCLFLGCDSMNFEEEWTKPLAAEEIFVWHEDDSIRQGNKPYYHSNKLIKRDAINGIEVELYYQDSFLERIVIHKGYPCHILIGHCKTVNIVKLSNARIEFIADFGDKKKRYNINLNRSL